jgi:hypothetical protein
MCSSKKVLCTKKQNFSKYSKISGYHRLNYEYVYVFWDDLKWDHRLWIITNVSQQPDASIFGI